MSTQACIYFHIVDKLPDVGACCIVVMHRQKHFNEELVCLDPEVRDEDIEFISTYTRTTCRRATLSEIKTHEDLWLPVSHVEINREIPCVSLQTKMV